MTKGYLSLVLHTHLPFVRHPEKSDYLEERWLFEAITESYIPLLMVFEGLLLDGISFRLTMSLTPTLLSMLIDPLLQNRYLDYLDNLVELSAKEVKRTEGDHQFHTLAKYYQDRFTGIRKYYVEDCNQNLISAFKRQQDYGNLELITCGATHGFFPLMSHVNSVRVQVKTAVDLHTRLFGRAPQGIWLPECGYRSGVEEILKEFNLKYFFTDTHGILHAIPKPQHGIYEPVYTPGGVAAFGRDYESAKQVWSSIEGYPGDYDYREYYRDIGYDLDFDYIKDYIHPSGIRINTGIKYHRITGKSPDKDAYRPDWAREKTALHAGNFMFNREKEIEYMAEVMERPPLVVAPYDTELFGHWWYEGPQFLNYLIRKMAFDQTTVQIITPGDYLQLYPQGTEAKISLCSWGAEGYSEVWLNPTNDWIYRHLHKMEEQMIELANLHPQADDLLLRALQQAARELLLAQSSDWAFIMKTGTMVEYAINRTKNHICRFNRLYQEIKNGNIDEAWLCDIEWLDNIFPYVDYRLYGSNVDKKMQFSYTYRNFPGKRKILMLSWEFPPMTVGGLARHVYDISRALTELGDEIHVLTCAVDGCPDYEIVEGVHVHRVQTFQEQSLQFQQWVLQLNVQMAVEAVKIQKKVKFDLIHAHDWLVAHAAKTLKERFGIPLVATIHATEHGRNQGINGYLQEHIHNLEWQLTYQAWRVICCSKYMYNELINVFNLPVDKIDVVPNGVDPKNLEPQEDNCIERSKFAGNDEKIVFFVGRLVKEKGVQFLLEAAPNILKEVPNTRFLIAGKGPMLEHLKNLACNLGIAEQVSFLGFIDDNTRNHLLRWSNTAVFPSLYEPFGIVALEAMAGHAPVIVSDTGGLGEIVEHGLTGFKVLPGNVESLVNHVTALLKDESLGRKMVVEAVTRIGKEYNWQVIAEQTQKVYTQVLTASEELRLFQSC